MCASKIEKQLSGGFERRVFCKIGADLYWVFDVEDCADGQRTRVCLTRGLGRIPGAILRCPRRFGALTRDKSRSSKQPRPAQFADLVRCCVYTPVCTVSVQVTLEAEQWFRSDSVRFFTCFLLGVGKMS